MGNAIYINGLGCISPQRTYDSAEFLPEVIPAENTRMKVQDPDYAQFIDPKLSRRMGRVLKFGVSAGLLALRDADTQTPAAIITGTGLGCLEDSGVFLKNITLGDEGVVSPTAFIQSTHNTVSGQIALTLSANCYNVTYAQRAHSFESALQDAEMMLSESDADNILVGAYDEITDYSFTILQRLKTEVVHGEGAAFFVLGKSKTAKSYAKIIAQHTFYKPTDHSEVTRELEAFITQSGLSADEIDLVLRGTTGNAQRDEIFHSVGESLFAQHNIGTWKNLCGEYHTSSAFALWLAAKMLHTQSVPPAVLQRGNVSRLKNVLVHNCYKQQHSLLLLQSC